MTNYKAQSLNVKNEGALALTHLDLYLNFGFWYLDLLSDKDLLYTEFN